MTTRINQFNIANTATPELAELTVTGNVSANYFMGNGSQLTGLPEGYGNANVIDLGESGWAGNIRPAANVTYDLGTATNRWRDIYLAGNTIYLGEAEISANATSISMTNPRGGRITVNGTESDLVANLINAGNIEATNFMLSRGNLQALTSIYTGDAQQWLSDTDTEPLGRLNLVVADLPGPAEIIMVNRDDDALAYAEFLAINDVGNISSGFCGIGINSSTYSDPEYPITQADDGFLLYTAPQGSLSSGNLVIGTGDTGQVNAIVFGAGGFATGNTQMVIMPDDRVEIIIPTESTSANTGALVVDGGLGVIGNVNVGGNLSLSLTSTVTANNVRALQHVWSGPVEQWLVDRDETDTGRRIAAVANIAGPAETLQVNLSSDPLAYSEFLAVNDQGNVSSGWISMGINSSTYSDPEFQLTGADDGYLLFESPAQTTGAGNLVIATGDQGGVNAIVFGAGGFATGNTQMAIFPDDRVEIDITTESVSTTTGALVVRGGIGLTGNLNVGGSVNIVGNITLGGSGNTIEVSALEVSDPLIYMGANNASDNLDLGFVGEYNDGAVKYTGLVRDATDATFRFFSNVSPRPNTTVDFGSANLVYPTVIMGNTRVNSGSPSFNTTTGALTVTGGAGITGAVHIGGSAQVSGNVVAGNLQSAGSISATGGAVLGGNITAVSGSLTTLTVSGNITTSNAAVSGTMGINTDPTVAAITANGKIVVGDSINNANIGNVLNFNSNSGATAFRPINLIDTSGLIKVVRINDLASNGPGIELQQWNTTISNQASYWDMYTTSAGFSIRDRGTPTRDRLVIDTVGRVLIGSTDSISTNSANLIANVANLNLQVLGSSYVSGNVGIGTTSFDSKLSIANKIDFYDTTPPDATSSTQQAVRFNNTVLSGSMVETANNADILSYAINTPQIGTRNDAFVGGIFRLDTRAAEKKFVVFGYDVGSNVANEVFTVKLDTGNVGIGTPTPVAPLQIAYTAGVPTANLVTSDAAIITAQNTAPGFSIVATGNSSGHRGVFKATRARGTLASPTVPNSGDETFSLLGAIYDGVTTRATAAVNMEVDGAVSSGVAPQRITFWTGNASSRVERVRIISTGNVGIGNTSPAHTLSVSGNAYYSGNVTVVGSISGTVATASQPNITSVGTLTSVTATGNITGGNLNTAGAVVVTGTAAATSTTTGSLRTAGGLGVAGNAYMGGLLSVTGNVTGGNLSVTGTGAVSNNFSIAGNLSVGTSSTTNKLEVSGTSGQLFTVTDSMTGTIFSVNDISGIPSIEVIDTGLIKLGEYGGNVVIGSGTDATGKLQVTGNVVVAGSISAVTKSFVIDHPTKPGAKLRHGSLEGPENGVYIRGKLCDNDTIELPEYWTNLVDPDSITVHLTAIGKHQKLYVKHIANNQVTVGTDDLFGKHICCFYTIFAERVDVEKLTVEY
jgi:hypothetical protein